MSTFTVASVVLPYEPMVAENEWFHLSITYDGSHVTIYEDVQQQKRVSFASKLNVLTTESIKIGDSTANGDPVIGPDFAIACVGLFSRNLSQAEISDVRRGCDYG